MFNILLVFCSLYCCYFELKLIKYGLFFFFMYYVVIGDDFVVIYGKLVLDIFLVVVN